MKKECIVFLVYLLLISHPCFSESEPGSILQVYDENQAEAVANSGEWNRDSIFSAVIPQKTNVFLVGNNTYDEDSGYAGLTQSHNDTMLIQQLLIRCCKVAGENISLYNDITLSDFREKFDLFKNKLDENAKVLLYFSGHGESNGSLVFTDGGKLTPSELRRLVNSFPNDTVLIVDACYFGNNEGPTDFDPHQESFKSNCVRIYASLAHLTAKEISYDNPFFKQSLPFYRDVLHLENIEGNGYFTALIGMFFTQYKFREQENISYQDIVYYVTNKAKIYVESLAKTKGSEQKGAWEEAVYRLNQLPKIHPVDQKIAFMDENHQYMLLQKLLARYRPQVNHVSLDYNAAVSITLPPYNESLGIGIMPLASLMYNFRFDWGILGFGFMTGTEWVSTYRGDYPFQLLVYPLALHTRYCSDLASPFYVLLDLSGGFGIAQLVFINESDFSKNALDLKFFWNMGVGIGINISKDFGIAASLGYSQLYPHSELYHYITPGIDIIHNVTGAR